MEKITEKNPGLKKIWMSSKNLDVLECPRGKDKNKKPIPPALRDRRRDKIIIGGTSPDRNARLLQKSSAALTRPPD